MARTSQRSRSPPCRALPAAQFDVDGDGLISYPEFLLVLTLLSIHERDVTTIFDVVDLDGNGLVDAGEFAMVMELLQNMANVHTRRVGRSHKLSR